MLNIHFQCGNTALHFACHNEESGYQLVQYLICDTLLAQVDVVCNNKVYIIICQSLIITVWLKGITPFMNACENTKGLLILEHLSNFSRISMKHWNVNAKSKVYF